MRLFKAYETSFENFDKTVKNYLSKTFSNLGLEYSDSQVFNVIYTGIKGVMQNMMLYIEDAFTEQNIETASRRRSIYSLASLSGYEPYYGTAASGIFVVTSVPSAQLTESSSKLYIRNHSAVINDASGLMYTIFLPSNEYVIDLNATLVKHRLKAVQGVWVTDRMTASGDSLEAFSIGVAQQYDKQYVEVRVNGEQYEQAASIYDMGEDDKMFVVKTSFDSTFQVYFGNGVHGHRLSEGDIVEVGYLVHDGQNGNIMNPGSEILKMMSPVYDLAGNAAVPNEYLKIAAEGQISGGTNSDTVKMVRDMVGWSSRSLVLASHKNIEQYLKRFSFIGKSVISSVPGTLKLEARCLSSALDNISDPADYLSLSPDKLLLTDEQKDMVVTSLENSGKVMTGVSIEMHDPVIRQYAMTCYVKSSSSYAKSSISASIDNAIGKYFMSLGTNVKFIPKSDIIKAVTSEVTGIESFDIDFISKAAEDAWHDGYWIKYERRLINGVWQYVRVKMNNDSNVIPGLDAYGNISVGSDIEVPILHGGFKYYPEKNGLSGMDSVMLETTNYVFI